MEPFQTLPEGIRRYLPAARVVRDALVHELTGQEEKDWRVVESFARERVEQLGSDGEVLLPLLAQAGDEMHARHETMLMIASLAVVMAEVDEDTLEIEP